MKLIPIYAWTKGYRNFAYRYKHFQNLPWAQGVVLLACVVLAMVLANLPFTKEAYKTFLSTNLTINVFTNQGTGFSFPTDMTVEKFINLSLIHI